MEKPGSRGKSRSSKDQISRVKDLGNSTNSINNDGANSQVLLEQLAITHGINLNQISGYQASGAAGTNG